MWAIPVEIVDIAGEDRRAECLAVLSEVALIAKVAVLLMDPDSKGEETSQKTGMELKSLGSSNQPENFKETTATSSTRPNEESRYNWFNAGSTGGLKMDQAACRSYLKALERQEGIAGEDLRKLNLRINRVWAQEQLPFAQSSLTESMASGAAAGGQQEGSTGTAMQVDQEEEEPVMEDPADNLPEEEVFELTGDEVMDALPMEETAEGEEGYQPEAVEVDEAESINVDMPVEMVTVNEASQDVKVVKAGYEPEAMARTLRPMAKAWGKKRPKPNPFGTGPEEAYTGGDEGAERKKGVLACHPVYPTSQVTSGRESYTSYRPHSWTYEKGTERGCTCSATAIP